VDAAATKEGNEIMTDLEYHGTHVHAAWDSDGVRVIIRGLVNPRHGVTRGAAVLLDGASLNHAAESLQQVVDELSTVLAGIRP
jgi:hypothetical protein